MDKNKEELGKQQKAKKEIYQIDDEVIFNLDYVIETEEGKKPEKPKKE